LRLLINGATGRMGRELITLIGRDPHLILAGAVTRSGHPLVGADAGEQAGLGVLGVAIQENLTGIENVDLIIDFSSAAGLLAAVDHARRLKAALLSGTTALDEAGQQALRDLGRETQVLWAPNMSLGVQALKLTVARAAAALGIDADCEIVESHHRGKRDAPSGTALELANAIAAGRGQNPKDVIVTARRGPRRPGEIGIVSLRGGDLAGEHQVRLLLDGETLELTHRAAHRAIFARGALSAARWLLQQSPGLYRLEHMFGH